MARFAQTRLVCDPSGQYLRHFKRQWPGSQRRISRGLPVLLRVFAPIYEASPLAVGCDGIFRWAPFSCLQFYQRRSGTPRAIRAVLKPKCPAANIKESIGGRGAKSRVHPARRSNRRTILTWIVKVYRFLLLEWRLRKYRFPDLSRLLEYGEIGLPFPSVCLSAVCPDFCQTHVFAKLLDRFLSNFAYILGLPKIG